MEIISQPFALFSTLTLGVYFVLPRRGQNAWLAACSLYFAVSWRLDFSSLLLLSIGINFFFGKQLSRKRSGRNIWLWLGIILNAAGLLYFRFAAAGYINLILRVISGGAGITTSTLIPIGFSFYTLQAISYLVDVYRGQIPAEEDLIDFAVYMAYFPRLLSGPIERAKTFIPQLKTERRVDNRQLSEAGWLILIGLFRKLVIAGQLFSLMPENIFTRPLEYGMTDRWLSLLIYGFWLYNDFAGYTSLVRGISLLFGIRLSPNFQQPFFSRTMLEFWNRWHMSLSFWLRDYIFFPVLRSLSRHKFSANSLIRITFPPLITMLLSGLWHNTSLSLAAWGVLHGLYQVWDHKAPQKTGYVPPKDRPVWKQMLLSLRVYVLLLPTWVLFATGGLKLAGRFFASLVIINGGPRIRPLEIFIPVIGLLLSFLIDWVHEHNSNKENPEKTSLSNNIQALCVAFMVFCVVLSILWSDVPSASFVYQGF